MISNTNHYSSEGEQGSVVRIYPDQLVETGLKHKTMDPAKPPPFVSICFLASMLPSGSQTRRLVGKYPTHGGFNGNINKNKL